MAIGSRANSPCSHDCWDQSDQRSAGRQTTSGSALRAAEAHQGGGWGDSLRQVYAPILYGKMSVPNVVSTRVFLVLRAAPEASCAVGEVRLTYQARGFCD